MVCCFTAGTGTEAEGNMPQLQVRNFLAVASSFKMLDCLSLDSDGKMTGKQEFSARDLLSLIPSEGLICKVTGHLGSIARCNYQSK